MRFRLDQLCDLVSDTIDPRDAGGSVYVGLEHVRPGALSLRECGSAAAVASAKARFSPGDVLYGKLRPYLDKAVLAHVAGVCSTELLVLRPRREVPGRFLVALLHVPSLRDHAMHSTHGVNHPRTSWSALAAYEEDLPPLHEWAEIGDALWTVQQAIEAQERLIAATRELKQAAMEQLFTRGLRGEPQSDTVLGRIPRSWQVKRFDEFVTLQRGHDLPQSAFRPGPVPVVGATRVMGYHDEANVKGPGVTVVRSGSSAGHVQYVEGDFWAHNVLLYVKDFHGNHPKFVYYCLSAMELDQFRSGAAVPTLNRNVFRSKGVAVPPPEEQVEIAELLSTIDRNTAIHKRKRHVLTELFETLLHDLMTGRVRAPEVAAEVEAATE